MRTQNLLIFLCFAAMSSAFAQLVLPVNVSSCQLCCQEYVSTFFDTSEDIISGACSTLGCDLDNFLSTSVDGDFACSSLPVPTNLPTESPTKFPTRRPTRRPTPRPTKFPTRTPTKFPVPRPTRFPIGPVFTDPPVAPNQQPKLCGSNFCDDEKTDFHNLQSPDPSLLTDFEKSLLGCEIGRDFLFSGIEKNLQNAESNLLKCQNSRLAETAFVSKLKQTEIVISAEDCASCCSQLSNDFDKAEDSEKLFSFSVENCLTSCVTKTSCFDKESHFERLGCLFALDFLRFSKVTKTLNNSTSLELFCSNGNLTLTELVKETEKPNSQSENGENYIFGLPISVSSSIIAFVALTLVMISVLFVVAKRRRAHLSETLSKNENFKLKLGNKLDQRTLSELFMFKQDAKKTPDTQSYPKVLALANFSSEKLVNKFDKKLERSQKTDDQNSKKTDRSNFRETLQSFDVQDGLWSSEKEVGREFFGDDKPPIPPAKVSTKF